MASIHRTARTKDQSKAEAYARKAGYKAGGAVRHDDEAEDRKLIAKMIGEEEKAEAKRVKRKRGGSVPGGASAMRLDKKPRGNKLDGGEAVYTKPNRSTVEKPKLTTTNVDKIKLPKRAAGGSIPKSVAGPQVHNGMGKLANLGKFAHKARGGKVSKREGGGGVDEADMPANAMAALGALRGGNRGRSPVDAGNGGVSEVGGSGWGRLNGRGPGGVRAPIDGVKAMVPDVEQNIGGDRKRGGKVARHAKGGAVKKPTVNVIVNTGPKTPEGGDGAKAAMLAAALGGAGKPPMPPPGLPPGGPVPPMGGPPMPGLPPGAGAPPPPMMRKSGGRIPMAKMGPKTIPMPEKITVRGYERRKGGKVC